MIAVIPLVYQNFDFDCSRACAAMVAPETPAPRPNSNGLSCEKFRAWAESHGILVAEGFGHTPQAGDILLFPMHFVVYAGETKKYIKINDPWDGKVRLSRRRFKGLWEGWLLRVNPA